jgi:hypothetical protein
MVLNALGIDPGTVGYTPHGYLAHSLSHLAHIAMERTLALVP